MQPEHRPHQQDPTVAVLDVGGVCDSVQQHAQRVYEYVTLLALDLLARIVAGRIVSPPFRRFSRFGCR
jgi:hypothetical protein